jgi:hypothetical protein
MEIRMRKVWNIDTETYYQSPKLNQGEFDYWLIGKVYYLEKLMKNADKKYHVEIMVVAPSQPTEEVRDSYLSGLGLDDEGWEEFEKRNDEAEMARLLAETGCGATVWRELGNNLAKLLKAMREQADLIELLFGFYLDKYVNRIGTTGWDMLKGDIRAGVNRRAA